MAVFWGALIVAVVFAIAAVAIGREARNLDRVPPRPVFDLDDAVAWVGDHLPFEVSAVLSHREVRQLLDWNLEYFRTKGVAGNGSTPHVDAPIVVGEADTVDFVLARAAQTGVTFTPEQVRAVLVAHLTYFETIGAIGPEAPDEP